MAQDPNNDMRERALETASIVQDALLSISQNIKNVIEDTFTENETIARNLGKTIEKDIKGLSKTGDILGRSYEKALEGSLKQADVDKIIQTRKIKEFEIQTKINALKVLVNKGDKEAIKLQEELTKQLGEVVSYNEEIEDELKKQLDSSNNINKALGITGDLLRSSQKILGKLGLNNLEEIISEANDEATKMAKNLTNNGQKVASLGDKFKVLGAGAKTLFAGIGKALIDPVFIFGTLVATVRGLIKLSGEFLKSQAKIGNAFNTSTELSKQIFENIRASSDLNYSPDELISGYERYNKAVGLNLAYNEENAKLMTDLVDKLGMSEEEAGKLVKTSLLLGKDFKSVDKTVTTTTNSFNKQNKTAVNLDDVFSKIANTSEATKYNILGGTEGLTRAAATASRYGREMDEIVSSAESLLDFQNSLEKQMKAEMFIGKSINLQKLQYASLTGDAETIAKEQARIINENWAATKGNVLAQQALAESLGLSKEQAAEIYNIKLKEAEIIRKQGPAALKQYQESLKVQAKQAKEAEKFDRTMESAINSLKTSLLPLVEAITPFFIKMAETMSSIAKSLSGETGKTIMAILGTAVGGGAIAYSGAKLIKGVKGLKDAFTGQGSEDQPGTKGKGGLAGVLEKITGKGSLGSSAKNPMYVYVTNLRDCCIGSSASPTPEDFDQPGRKRSSNKKTQKNKKKPKHKPKTSRFPKKSKGLLGILDTLSDLIQGYGDESIIEDFDQPDKKIPDPKPKPKPKPNQYRDPKTGRFTKKPKGFLGKMKNLFNLSQGSGGTISKLLDGASDIGKSAIKGIKNIAGKGLGGLKSILGGPIAKGFGKALGPILTAISGISDVYSVITDAKAQQAQGRKIDFGSIGKKIVQAGAYPIANLSTNLIPGVGQAISIADATLGAFGMSPIKWITDNLIDLIPDSAFEGLGKLAVGDPKKMAIGGIVTKPTNAIVGEAGNEAVIPLNEFYKKLDELISVVKQGGHIYLDGKKVGTAMAMGSYRVQ